MKQLNSEDFRESFGLWFDKFKPFIEGEQMFDTYKTLKEEKEVVVPSSDCTFRSFQLSNPRNIKTIWYLMDPYPRRYKGGVNQATGIPMDCSNTPDGKIQPSLEIFYDTISRDMGDEVEYNKSLEYLLEQGVLLLNTELTVKLNKTKSHEGLWEPFQKFFLEEVMSGTTGIVYVLSGNVSHRMEKYINPLGNYIFKIEHPAAASHKHTDWDAKDIFNKTNKILKANNNEYIYWNKQEWDNEKFRCLSKPPECEEEECPF